MKTRKHQCRIQLAASEPVAYRLVFLCSVLIIVNNNSNNNNSADNF